MPNTSIFKLVLTATAAASLLAGCAHSPADSDFLEQIAKAPQAPVCLALYEPSSGGPVAGSLGTGWVTFPDSSDPVPSIGVRHVDQAKALESAGLLQSVAASVYVKGEAVPGRRFYLTAAGRQVLDSRPGGYGRNCFLLGYRKVAGIEAFPDATGKELRVHKSNVDGIDIYSARVSLTLEQLPAWAKNPSIQRYFNRELTEALSPAYKSVELLESSDKWVTREALARSHGLRNATAPLTDIPPGLAALARLRIEDRLRQSERAELALPMTASETPPEMRKALPGAIYFAFEPNQFSYTGQPDLARNPAQSAMNYQRDTYLNQRSELIEVLDVLVEQGLMARKQVAAGEAGAPGAGTVYSPTGQLANSRVSLGTISLTGDPVKLAAQQVGQELRVAAPYVWKDVPAWVPAAAKKLPFLNRYLAPGTVEATITGPSHQSSAPLTVNRVVLR